MASTCEETEPLTEEKKCQLFASCPIGDLDESPREELETPREGLEVPPKKSRSMPKGRRCPCGKIWYNCAIHDGRSLCPCGKIKYNCAIHDGRNLCACGVRKQSCFVHQGEYEQERNERKRQRVLRKQRAAELALQKKKIKGAQEA